MQDKILRYWLDIHINRLFYDVCKYSSNYVLILDNHSTINNHVMVDMWDKFDCFDKPIFKYIDQETSNSSSYLLNKYGDEWLEIVKDALDDYVENYKKNNIDYLVWKRREG